MSLARGWVFGLGIVGAVVFAIVVLLLLFLRSRIKIAIQLVKEASR